MTDVIESIPDLFWRNFRATLLRLTRKPCWTIIAIDNEAMLDNAQYVCAKCVLSQSRRDLVSFRASVNYRTIWTRFGQILIRNSCGEDGFNGWQIDKSNMMRIVCLVGHSPKIQKIGFIRLTYKISLLMIRKRSLSCQNYKISYD